MRRASAMWLVIGTVGGLGLVVGCKQTLETGYEPRPLNATADTRRAYYAAPYSPEAQVRDAKPDTGTAVRPGLGGGR